MNFLDYFKKKYFINISNQKPIKNIEFNSYNNNSNKNNFNKFLIPFALGAIIYSLYYLSEFDIYNSHKSNLLIENSKLKDTKEENIINNDDIKNDDRDIKHDELDKSYDGIDNKNDDLDKSYDDIDNKNDDLDKSYDDIISNYNKEEPKNLMINNLDIDETFDNIVISDYDAIKKNEKKSKNWFISLFKT